MATPVSVFFRDLRTFGKTLISDSKELRASVERNLDTEVGYSQYSYASGLLSQLKSEIYEAQEETDNLFSAPTDCCSLEDMVKICNLLYENNQYYTNQLEEKVRQYGYTPASKWTSLFYIYNAIRSGYL